MELFIGIDQSINSTGLTIELFDTENNMLMSDGEPKLKIKHFYIITGKEKLTAKEQKAQESYSEFDYVQYQKTDVKSAENNHVAEIIKTNNLIGISRTIIAIISSVIKTCNDLDVYVCMEGISYQSTNTSALLDLAGLNYIIRYDLFRYFKSVSEAINIVKEFELIIAPPAEIKKFASGNGAAKKEIMVSLFETSHPNLYLIPKIDDIADSYWMAEYAKYIYDKNHGHFKIFT